CLVSSRFLKPPEARPLKRIVELKGVLRIWLTRPFAQGNLETLKEEGGHNKTSCRWRWRWREEYRAASVNEISCCFFDLWRSGCMLVV
ncbi:MAG: hypothetical protein MJE68_25275, partial [Proteobacteria bacterium]|nr:hypothetical protein [Pseudomonadota bacterium]